MTPAPAPRLIDGGLRASDPGSRASRGRRETRPLLFSDPMVQALLRNPPLKTQTRRPRTGRTPQIGDVYYAREAYKIGTEDADGGACEFVYRADGHRVPATALTDEQNEWMGDIWTTDPAASLPRGQYHEDKLRWHGGIHMPRWAARIWLQVTDVREQHVQDITEEDALAEATCIRHNFTPAGHVWLHDDKKHAPSPRACFQRVWDELHARKPDLHWQANPVIRALTFQKLAGRPEP